jgi:hypothetical protein
LAIFPPVLSLKSEKVYFYLKLVKYGTHQLLVYADDVNLLGENITQRKKNAEALLDASKEIGLEVNSEKTKYMFMSRHQTAGPVII